MEQDAVAASISTGQQQILVKGGAGQNSSIHDDEVASRMGAAAVSEIGGPPRSLLMEEGLEVLENFHQVLKID